MYIIGPKLCTEVERFLIASASHHLINRIPFKNILNLDLFQSISNCKLPWIWNISLSRNTCQLYIKLIILFILISQIKRVNDRIKSLSRKLLLSWKINPIAEKDRLQILIILVIGIKRTCVWSKVRCSTQFIETEDCISCRLRSYAIIEIKSECVYIGKGRSVEKDLLWDL